MDHVFKRPDGESARSLSTIIFFGRSSEDMHAIELIKQSCLQSTNAEISNEPIRLVRASDSRDHFTCVSAVL